MSERRADALPEGTEIQAYKLGAVLGAGGFGITYRGVERFTDRPVAIKEFLPTTIAQRAPDGVSVRPLSQPGIDFDWGLERFRLEARTLIALKHPNIVPVLQYFEANGTGYLVMEYQSGDTLAARLKPGRHLDAAELARILPPLLDALEAVHAKGFLHRDIKPDNIFIRGDGTPLLIDFGAARQAVGAKQTLTAIVSDGYAPLEQYEAGSAQGPWTDIYALGCTLYRCMTGVRPAPATKRATDRLAQMPDPVEPVAKLARETYPPGLVNAVGAAMRPAPQERPQTIAALRALVGEPAPGPPADLSSRKIKRRAPPPVAAPEPPRPPAEKAWPTQDRDTRRRLRRRVRMGAAGGLALVLLAVGGHFGLRVYDQLRFDNYVAAAETAIGAGAYDDAQRSLDAAARIDADNAALPALRERLARARRAKIGGEQKPQLVLPVRDCPECPELVEIPAGTFTMGAPESEIGSYPKERPQRAVAVSRPFLMGRTEVTVGQFRLFLKKSGYKLEHVCATFDAAAGTYRPDRYATWEKPDFPVGDNHPVVCVSWHDARAYAAWLSRETGKTYRLPSEAEWEYAARAGEKGARPWGDDLSQACRHANVADATGRERLPKGWDAFPCDDHYAFTAPAGSFRANDFGLHDMLGNVWEWVEDCLNESYAGAPADQSARLGGDCETRIMRGGAWISQIRDVRLAMRGFNRADRGYYSTGFRVVREK